MRRLALEKPAEVAVAAVGLPHVSVEAAVLEVAVLDRPPAGVSGWVAADGSIVLQVVIVAEELENVDSAAAVTTLLDALQAPVEAAVLAAVNADAAERVV